MAARPFWLLLWLLTSFVTIPAEGLPVKTYTAADGLLRDQANQIRQDSRGFLWFCTNDGLSRFDGYGFTNYTTDDGLPHRVVNDPLETRSGVIWVATENGLARFNPKGRRSASDSSRNSAGPMFIGYWPEAKVARSMRVLFEDAQDRLWCGTDEGLYWSDAQGDLWFGGRGLARLIPEPDRPRQVPTILLTGLRVAGAKQPVSELGEESLSALTLGSLQTQVSVDFLGLGASLGEELKYQYKLEGAQNDWSEPTPQRSVDFAHLAPGAYRLLVKAITAEGAASAKPAAFTFTILRPVWQRLWFLLLVVTAATLALSALHRYRVARLLELERVRTRIASDLHDAIGSNLSLIAGLSEMLRKQVDGSAPQAAERLSLIASVSRKSVDAMSDIVWAINPKRDHLRDLVQRMRRFASDTLTARNIELHFTAPKRTTTLRLALICAAKSF